MEMAVLSPSQAQARPTASTLALATSLLLGGPVTVTEVTVDVFGCRASVETKGQDTAEDKVEAIAGAPAGR